MRKYIECDALDEFFAREIRLYENCPDKYDAAIELQAASHLLPAADARPVVRGEWIPPRFPYPWYKATCSRCGYEDPLSHGGCEEWNGVEWKAMSFCPNCGADMRNGGMAR